MLVQGNKRYCKSIWLWFLKVGPPPLLRLHDEQPDNPYLIDPIKTMQKSYFEALSKKDNRFSIWIYKDEDGYPLYDRPVKLQERHRS
jgi:hypothetical protein